MKCTVPPPKKLGLWPSEICKKYANPRIDLGIDGSPSGQQIAVAIVPRELDKAGQSLPGQVGGSDIDGVVALTDAKGRTIHPKVFNRGGNKDIRVSIPIAVSVSWQIIGIEKITNLIELRDWFAVIACDSGRKVLRRQNSSGSGSIGRSGDRDRRSRAPRIGVENLIMNNDALGWIGHERGGS